MCWNVAECPSGSPHGLALLWFQEFFISVKMICRQLARVSSCSGPGASLLCPCGDLAMRKAGLPIISEELKGYLAVRKCIHFKCVLSVFQKEMSLLISCPFAIAVWFQVREAYKTCLFFSLFRCLYFLELCWLIPFSDKQLWLEFLFHSTL